MSSSSGSSIPQRPSETGWPRHVTGPFDSVLTIRCQPEEVDAILARVPWDMVVENLADGTMRLHSGWRPDHVWSPTELTVVRMLSADGLTLGWSIDWRPSDRQPGAPLPPTDFPPPRPHYPPARRDEMGRTILGGMTRPTDNANNN